MKLIDGLKKSEYIPGGIVKSPFCESLSNTESKGSFIPLDVYERLKEKTKEARIHGLCPRMNSKDLIALINRRNK